MIGHIIDHYGIKPSSEEAGYLAGYVGALFTKPIKNEICDCCKKKTKINHYEKDFYGYD